MGNALILAFYITICCIAFVISKIIIAVLIYRRWKRKHLVFEHGFSGIEIVENSMKYAHWKLEVGYMLTDVLLCDFTGGKMVLFRAPVMQSLKSDVFLKKTLKLSNKDIIGSGGYGTVYKLTVNETMAFAVKRLNRGSADTDRGFERELEAMGDIKHRNIVTLHGYYTAPHYNLLIYELVANGSLDGVLHGMCVGSISKNFTFEFQH